VNHLHGQGVLGKFTVTQLIKKLIAMDPHLDSSVQF
jgi:hypothetical protein